MDNFDTICNGDAERILGSIKRCLRIKTDTFDDEIKELFEAALLDLSLVGIETAFFENALIFQAIKTYIRLKFGQPVDYDRLKSSYDEQKAQLMTSSEYRKIQVMCCGGEDDG